MTDLERIQGNQIQTLKHQLAEAQAELKDAWRLVKEYREGGQSLSHQLAKAQAANAQYEVDLDVAQNLAEIYKTELDKLKKPPDLALTWATTRIKFLEGRVTELGEELARVKSSLNEYVKTNYKLTQMVVNHHRDQGQQTQPDMVLEVEPGQEITVTIKVK